MQFEHDVVVLGGCGHVGLPLAIALAGAGLRTIAYDVSLTAVNKVNGATMPFEEPGAPERLTAVLGNGMFRASQDAAVIAKAEHLVVVVGTPVDEHLNPDPQAVIKAIAGVQPHLRDGQVIVLRSTIYPGVTRLVERFVESTGLDIDIAFCPERIAEGKAFTELYELPQLVSGRTPQSVARARKLFERLASDIVEVEPEEAELAKLFTNTWRYIKFAAANQLYMIANDFGLDFERIRHAITFNYPRAADMPGPGFAAGPCLFKDTMQLAAFNNNNFTLGHASMMVNEGLPLYVVARLEAQHDLSKMTVGILGMAFKGESDDVRSSLSYKLKRILKFKAGAVLCTDPFVTTDPDLVPLERVLDESDLLVVGTPHKAYRSIAPTVPTADVWNVLAKGVKV